MSLSSIKRQVEYYFADFNLMRDQFLKNEIKLSKEAGKNGFVDLDIMLKFNKLANLTTDKAKIVESLSESKLVELNEEKTGLRRNPERKLPVDDEIYRAGLKARTVFVEGFPRDNSGDKEEDLPPITLDQIYDYFTVDPLKLEVETIAMRRIKNTKDPNSKLLGRFTGSCFVTFSSQSESEKFLESDQKFKHESKEFELKKMTKAMYWSMQNAEHDAKKRGGNVEAAIEAAKKAAETAKPVKFEEGIVIKFSDVTDSTIRREDIKTFILEKEGAVEYISFESGKSEGLILLNLEHGKKAKEILGLEGDDQDSHKQNIKGNEVNFQVVGEKDFESVQTEFLAFKKKMDLLKMSGGKGKFGKGKFGKGGRGGKGGFKGKKNNRNEEDSSKNTRKRFADSDDEATGEKVAKVE